LVGGTADEVRPLPECRGLVNDISWNIELCAIARQVQRLIIASATRRSPSMVEVAALLRFACIGLA
jgi:hypothetical protein